MDRPFPAYKGNEQYIFVSYAHADDSHVYQEIQWLHQQGFNLWYDEGISPGSEWHSELAESIENASLFLYFITPRSVKSDHCQREVHFAIDRKIPVLAVHLEAAEMSPGLDFSLGSTQAIIRYELADQEYRAKLLAGTSDHIQRGIAREPATRSPMRSRKNATILALALVGLLAAAVIALVSTNQGDDPNTADTIHQASTKNSVDQPQTSIRSNWIAVLPFRTVSAASGDTSALLAEGVTGDLISALSDLGTFSVSSHGAVRAYIDSSSSPPQISADMGVRYLVEGRVQISQGHTRVGVTLVDGVTGKTLWEETKSYASQNHLQIQDDVARFVTRALDIELLRFEGERVRNLAIDNMQAWDHWVSAMRVWDNPTRENFLSAINDHRRALALDPNYVLSLGQLATVTNISTVLGESPDREAARTEACQLADRAIALGQKSPHALFSAVSVLAGICGEADKAVQIGRQAVVTHTDSGYNQTILGWALAYSGKFDEALQVLEKAERDFPDNIYVLRYSPWFKAVVYTEQQAWGKALEVSRTALNLNPSDMFTMIMLANELGSVDRIDEANAVWNQLVTRFPNFTVENYAWWLKQGLLTDERVEPFVRGLERASGSQ
jgi:TolB-like protein/Tfp pilus assembly protein PilF